MENNGRTETHSYPSQRDCQLSITDVAAPDYAQDLTFEKLLIYCGAKGLALKHDSIVESFNLKNKDGQFNVLAYILSDQNSIPIRVSIFCGTDKTAPLFSVKEFGNTCILYSLEKVLECGDAIFLIQADKQCSAESKGVPLFDYGAYREAILNAFLHNKWLTLNGPQISIFTDRIEILSHGGLAFGQDIEGFYSGASIPVNEVLASIFLQLRISERSGRGVPKIIGVYGKDSIKIDKNRVTVTISFNKWNINSFDIAPGKVYNKVYNKINQTQEKIINSMRNNPNITITQLTLVTGLTDQAIKKNLKTLKDLELIKRVGAKKNGYWEVLT